MWRLMLTAAVLSTGISVAPDARAEPFGKPTVDDVRVAFANLRKRVIGAKAIEDMTGVRLAVPFWYVGYEYVSGNRADASCKTTWGANGTVTQVDQLDDFVVCLSRAVPDHVGPDLQAGAHPVRVTWAEANFQKLPEQFKDHRTKLAKLARDHLIVISHDSATRISHHEPGGESWNVYVAHRDGRGVVLDALLVAIKER